MHTERYPMRVNQHQGRLLPVHPIKHSEALFRSIVLPKNSYVAINPLQEYSCFRLSLCHQLRELFFGGFETFRTLTYIRKPCKMRSQWASGDNYSEGLHSIFRDDLRYVGNFWINTLHLCVESLLRFI